MTTPAAKRRVTKSVQLTVTARDPENVTGTPRAKHPSRPTSRIAKCDVVDDIIAMGNMTSPAEEAHTLQIFEITLEYATNFQQESSALRLIQKQLGDQTMRQTLTLVVTDTEDTQSPELTDSKRGLLVNVPVKWGSPDDQNVDFADPESVPAKIETYARCAAGRFEESAEGLVRVTAIYVYQLATRDLIYTL